MRIWDLDPGVLCDQHLLGEHRELHGIWSILTNGRAGYANHPETLRWRGRLAALYARHEDEIAEMDRRGFRHASPLDERLATGQAVQTELVDSLEVQRARLESKGCGCPNFGH
jgi:Pyrimidine dimer DNA glycosylase